MAARRGRSPKDCCIGLGVALRKPRLGFQSAVADAGTLVGPFVQRECRPLDMQVLRILPHRLVRNAHQTSAAGSADSDGAANTMATRCEAPASTREAGRHDHLRGTKRAEATTLSTYLLSNPRPVATLTWTATQKGVQTSATTAEARRVVRDSFVSADFSSTSAGPSISTSRWIGPMGYPSVSATATPRYCEHEGSTLVL